MDTVFSAHLQKLRKEHNVTQETLAAHLGVSPQAVSKWENGSYPDGDLLPKIADFFGVSIDYLYGKGKGEIFCCSASYGRASKSCRGLRQQQGSIL